ncbi:hypothetical protein [Pseudomonas putida]
MTAQDYLHACAAAGKEANFETKFPNASDRVLDALWIREALLSIPDSNPQCQGAALPALRSLRVNGANIRGELDLKCCGSAYHPLPSLSLQHCCFEPTAEQLASIDLSNAHLGSLSLAHSQFKQLRGNGMYVEGSVDLSGIGPLQEGGLCWCNLARVHINGHLLADAVQLRALGAKGKSQNSALDKPQDFFELDYGLNLYMSEIEGSILVRKSARIDGGLLLDCAHVKGDVRMDSVSITALERNYAIAIERTTIEGSLTFALSYRGKPMQCEGLIWLWHTTIGGSFELMHAQLHGAIEKDQDTLYLIALYACFLKIYGSVTIVNVRSQGLICLQGTEVGNCLELNDVKIIQGASQLPSWFRTPSWMLGTSDNDTQSFALDLRGVQVASILSLRSNQLCGGIDLSGASCKTLDDDEAGYNKATPVVIDGLTYERLEHFGSRIGEDFNNWRLTRWLPTQIEHYVPQPFVQLAHVLAHHGDDAHARDVLVTKASLDAKRRWYTYHHSTVPLDCTGQSWQLLRLWIRRAIYFCFIKPYGAFFDFGLSPGKALLTLVGAILLGWLVFGQLNDHHMMVVAQTPVAGYVSASNNGTLKLVPEKTTTATGNIHCGNEIRPLVYATDVFIPLVDLREESKCDVDAAGDFNPSDWFVTACRFFKAAYALLGWVVTTLSLLTFSGVMRHRLTQD